LADFFQFGLVLRCLTVLVETPPRWQVVSIVLSVVGFAVWRVYAMTSAPRVLTQRDSAALGTATPVHEGTV